MTLQAIISSCKFVAAFFSVFLLLRFMDPASLSWTDASSLVAVLCCLTGLATLCSIACDIAKRQHPTPPEDAPPTPAELEALSRRVTRAALEGELGSAMPDPVPMTFGQFRRAYHVSRALQLASLAANTLIVYMILDEREVLTPQRPLRGNVVACLVFLQRGFRLGAALGLIGLFVAWTCGIPSPWASSAEELYETAAAAAQSTPPELLFDDRTTADGITEFKETEEKSFARRTGLYLVEPL
ncbi:hypothetical protein GGX14DRAFT_608862 [Mycena pura]|uniref:Uncharacterized protein n=1 Tax=Mycena pura TaxID=153505 RepID=A0AAD6XVQ3_9AGAR|nr:hypothetical protein GGX14DRAFT_608862 [Mycena pura]